MSNPAYPVMPGDVYKLTYLSSHQLVSMEVIVSSDFIINLAIFGKINAKNMTFNKIKSIVEQKVEQAYPGSTPSLTIISVGSFQVYLTGEVKQSVNITAWGLTLLSDVVEEYFTPYSSNRDIEVLSEDGSGRQYDLFKANRFGQRKEDPYIKPGNTIVIAQREREVVLAGEIKRPGSYQLLAGDTLKELINYYGNGFTRLANHSRIRLQRVAGGNGKIAESYLLDLTKENDLQFELQDLDSVTVPSKLIDLPVIYLEGAIINNESKTVSSTPGTTVTANKLTVAFKEGDTLYNL